MSDILTLVSIVTQQQNYLLQLSLIICNNSQYIVSKVETNINEDIPEQDVVKVKEEHSSGDSNKDNPES